MKKILIQLMVLLVLVACENKVNMERYSTSVSLSEAHTAAVNIVNSRVVKSILEAQPGVTFLSHSIKDITPVPDETNPSYYIVNYGTGGWAVIAGDKRVSPVLAFAEKGSLNQGTIPGGLGSWLIGANNQIQQVKTSGINSNVAPCPIASEWAIVNVLAPPTTTPCTTCQDQYSSSIVGPLTTSLFYQGPGFNNYAPACSPWSPPSSTNPRCPIGCVPTAVAQVAYYWKKGPYNWAAMDPTYGGDEASRLLINIVSGISNFTFSCDGSGMSCGTSNHCDGGVTGVFKNQLGYVSAAHGNSYDFQTVRASLDAKQPVILGAFRDEKCILGFCYPKYDGHAWVSDGYQSYSYLSCATGSGWITNYLHMNWGWGAGYNAWVNETDWAVNVQFSGESGPSVKDFNYFRDMYYAIHP